MVDSWNVEQVCRYLAENGLEDLQQIFRDEDINGQAFLRLTEPLLEKMGIGTIGKRLRVLSAIETRPTVLHLYSATSKIFNDPIHGSIEFHPLIIRIIDTPQFQRLRYIKQLGGCYYVYPGASHNRFEHSLGVCYLAGQLTKNLRSRQPELNITDKDVLCVQIAGLCHDLGHGPFSHVFDGKFLPEVNQDKTVHYNHDILAGEMFKHMMGVNNLEKELKIYNLGSDDIDFILEQISPRNGHASSSIHYTGRDQDKHFLYEEADNLYGMFFTRLLLYKRAYQHQTKSLIEEMIVEALVKANDHIKILGKDRQPLKMSEAVTDMVAYTNLTDHVFEEILYSDRPELAEARAILMKINNRHLYKYVDRVRPKHLSETREEMAEMYRTLEKASRQVAKVREGCVPLQASDFLIQVVNVNFGLKAEDPIDKIWSYKKTLPNVPEPFDRYKISPMLPATFGEQYVRVYCKKTKPDRLALAKKSFVQWCTDRGYTYPEKKVSAMLDDTGE